MSLPILARFSMDARSASAEERLEGEVSTKDLACASLVSVSSARLMRSSSWPPNALPDDISFDMGWLFSVELFIKCMLGFGNVNALLLLLLLLSSLPFFIE